MLSSSHATTYPHLGHHHDHHQHREDHHQHCQDHHQHRKDLHQPDHQHVSWQDHQCFPLCTWPHDHHRQGFPAKPPVMIIINMKEWKHGRVILPSGMHGQSFFPSGWGGTGHRVKSLEQGGVTVKPGAFLGRGGAVLKIFGAGIIQCIQ